MKIASLGDIHGRDTWKFHTHGSPYDYNLWKIAVDAGAPVDSEVWKDMPYSGFDKIVFVGDYVDSFTIGNAQMKQNLLEIIEFKRLLGDKVVLLLGNHDVSYIVPDQWCSGYRSEMRHDFFEIFNKNIDLFSIAYEIESDKGEKYLWTHAGVTSGWLEKFNKALANPSNKSLKSIIEDHDPMNRKISENLNFAWELRMKVLFNVDMYSGGIEEWAGPIWVRPIMLNQHPLTGYNQIVGHTPQATIYDHDIDEKTIHYFIDCLEHGDGESLILDIEKS